MKEPEIIVSIGAEGGSIQLFGYRDSDGEWKFARAVNDQTPIFLTEDNGPAINHTSRWVSTWTEAVALLDKYPWASLAGLEVHPDFQNRVWEEVEGRLLIVPKDYAERSRQRWARVCGIAQSD